MAAAPQTPLSAAETNALKTIAGTMIPEEAALGMPGADDPAIFDDIVRSMGRDLPLVREALAAIVTKAGNAFADMGRDAREALINDWYGSGGAPAWESRVFSNGAPYRDDRVLVALGHEARSPFPKGYVLEPGDWSLLDAVRDRAPFWRDDRIASDGER